MRYHGQARVSPRTPEAFAICDRCGFLYNHVDLQWQFDWQGPRTQNLRILVCQSCLDKPFEHNRTLILPPDPVAIGNARPENYVLADNPISPVGLQPLDAILGSNAVRFAPIQTGSIGNMTNGIGIDGPYYGPFQRRSDSCALLRPSRLGFNNYVGKFWSAVPGVPTMILPGLTANGMNGLKYGIGSFVAQAPTDQSFVGNAVTPVNFYGFDGTNWNLIWTGSTAGQRAEVLNVTLPSQVPYYAHAIVFFGDGFSSAAIAQLQLNAVTHGIHAPTISDPPAPVSSITFVPLVSVPFVDSAPTFGLPTLRGGQFNLFPVSIAVSSPILGTPTCILPGTAFTAVNFLDSSPLIGVPLLQQSNLAPTSFADSSPTLGTPVLSTTYPFIAVPIGGASASFGTPVLTQLGFLTATSLAVTTSPTFGTPTLVPSFVPLPAAVNLAAGAPLLGSPTLLPNIQPSSFADSAPSFGTPTITQLQKLAAVGVVDSAPQIGVPTLNFQIVNLAVTVQAVSPILGTPSEGTVGGSVNPLPPATALQTSAAKIDAQAAFAIVIAPATSITTKPTITDNLPAFTP